MPCVTTYQYRPLESERHIRLLKLPVAKARYPLINRFPRLWGSNRNPLPNVDFIHVSVDGKVKYETLSYAWGDDTRVGELQIAKTKSHVALTQSLLDALSHLVKHSCTGLLWIDQLCIDQDNTQEREQQVSIMGEVFRKSNMTFVWLGLDDESGRLVAEWGEIFESIDRDNFPNGSYRRKLEMEEISRRESGPPQSQKHCNAPVLFQNCTWLSRGWIIQEYLLSKAVTFMWGSRIFPETIMQDLDSVCTHSLHAFHGQGDMKNTNFMRLNYNREAIRNKKTMECLDLLFVMSATSRHFETRIDRDGLFAYLGIWKPPSFHPNYSAPLEEVLTDFAHCIATDTGCLDFLSLVKTHEVGIRSIRNQQLLSLPSWVPQWSSLSPEFPWSLALGFHAHPSYNAAKSLPHRASQTTVPHHLRATGRILEHIRFTSEINLSFVMKDEPVYISFCLSKLIQEASKWQGILNRIGKDIIKLLLSFCPDEVDTCPSVDEVLSDLEEGKVHHSISYALSMVLDRKLMTDGSRRLGLIPIWCKEGNAIAIIHGCRVPLIISKNEEHGTYTVLGDCYLEGVMHGEAVDWKENEGDEFILS